MVFPLTDTVAIPVFEDVAVLIEQLVPVNVEVFAVVVGKVQLILVTLNVKLLLAFATVTVTVESLYPELQFALPAAEALITTVYEPAGVDAAIVKTLVEVAKAK